MNINKVSMSKEAKADYADVFGEEMIEKISKGIIDDVFTYIQIRNVTKTKFKVKYYDEENDAMLMIFVNKHFEKTTSMLKLVRWGIEGICLDGTIIQELDEEGIIRIWLKSYLL